ncbi:MAG: DUF4426 domain-containing protein [Gammaproteobacteria bacterium]|nr:DUF4426 domain-containing protein [Gammaproteobacteria bacterium]MCW8987357.1 DUF4426 domain-containing protein [Gammaproteobacteria bacterium]MCW9031353.1 DUF4426 domain-containing protein [Gammaproteobacteria bacterium]
MALSRLIVRFLGVAILLSLPFSSNAENITKFGDYVIHHTALPTDILLPEVARAYKIKRSKDRGMINIVVQHKGKGTNAKVTGTGSNLNAQLKHLQFNEIKEGDVTYYISTFRVTHKEVITFKIDVQPVGSNATHTVKFKKEFYTH